MPSEISSSRARRLRDAAAKRRMFAMIHGEDRPSERELTFMESFRSCLAEVVAEVRCMRTAITDLTCTVNGGFVAQQEFPGTHDFHYVYGDWDAGEAWNALGFEGMVNEGDLGNIVSQEPLQQDALSRTPDNVTIAFSKSALLSYREASSSDVQAHASLGFVRAVSLSDLPTECSQERKNVSYCKWLPNEVDIFQTGSTLHDDMRLEAAICIQRYIRGRVFNCRVVPKRDILEPGTAHSKAEMVANQNMNEHGEQQQLSKSDVLVSRLDYAMEVLNVVSGRIPQDAFQEMLKEVQSVTHWMRDPHGDAEMSEKVAEFDVFMNGMSERMSKGK